jgi:hypothetical protein
MRWQVFEPSSVPLLQKRSTLNTSNPCARVAPAGGEARDARKRAAKQGAKRSITGRRYYYFRVKRHMNRGRRKDAPELSGKRGVEPERAETTAWCAFFTYPGVRSRSHALPLFGPTDAVPSGEHTRSMATFRPVPTGPVHCGETSTCAALGNPAPGSWLPCLPPAKGGSGRLRWPQGGPERPQQDGTRVDRAVLAPCLPHFSYLMASTGHASAASTIASSSERSASSFTTATSPGSSKTSGHVATHVPHAMHVSSTVTLLT